MSVATEGKTAHATDVNSVQSLVSAKGSLIAGSSASVFAEIPIGTGVQILQVMSTCPTGIGWGAVGSASSLLGSDVTISTSNVFYDGPTLTLAAGTWFPGGVLCVYNGSGTQTTSVTVKLWNGTTAYASAETTIPVTSVVSIPIPPIGGIVTTSSSTFKLSATKDSSASTVSIKAGAVTNAAGSTASYISAIQLA